MTARVNRPINAILDRFIASSLMLVGKRPQPELLFGDLPEPGEPIGLDHQKEDDERSEDHQLDLLLQGHRHGQPDQVRGVGEKDGDEHDEGGPQEGSEDTSETSDDDHEEDEERQVDVEGQGLRAAQIEEDQLGPRHAAVERADGEGEQRGAHGRTPMISAAMSRSRMAIQERPTRPRTRFLATNAQTTTRANAARYRTGAVASGPV